MMRLRGALTLIVAFFIALAGAAPASRAASDNALPSRSELIKKLGDDQFKALDAELSSYQQQYEQDPAREMNAIIAYAAFETTNGFISEHLDAWVKASPDSYAAALAHALSLMELAWRWRGNGFANQVTKTQWQQMRKSLAQAVAEANRALAINPNLSIAHALLIEAAKMDGTEMGLARASREAIQSAPASFAIREAIMESLMPRWGGSHDAMVAFAKQSQSYAERNPAIRFLKAWPTIDQCFGLGDRKQWRPAVACYTRAIDETNGQYWWPIAARAETYYTLGEYQLSMQDAMSADALFPMQSSVIKLLAYDAAKLKRPEASGLYIAEYLKYDTPDPDMFSLFQSQESALKASGVLPRDNPSRPHPKFASRDASIPEAAYERFYKLGNLAVAAQQAGDFGKAENYARELLSDAPSFQSDWNYGNAIFTGNMIIGLVALKRDDSIPRADTALLDSASTPGSPQLKTIGPNMTLAQALLERGERTTVLEFLSRCRTFWTQGGSTLDDWTKIIEQGGTPDFGNNLPH
jgi:tetratricopeptide (TPR) repeat protein